MIYKKSDIDMSLVECPYEEDVGYIYISDDYTNNLLKLSGYSDISNNMYIDLCDHGGLKHHLYEYALNHAANAYYYAFKILKGRFQLGEKAIATDSEYSYWYARDVLGCRFELGEQTIASNATFSYFYAKDVVKGRFELGEKSIINDNYYRLEYLYLCDNLENLHLCDNL
jgi:hypothetical protein